MHYNQAKAKQAGAVAPYSEEWTKKVSVRELFPKALPVIVHTEASVSHKAGLGLDYLGSTTKELGVPNYQGERVLSQAVK